MANAATDPKAAPLAEDLKEYALSLSTTAYPKNFFCALCNELAVDAYKLLCCNKAICTECQAKLAFPTTCPSCDHSPLEADSCAPNKALRNTMRVWLQKQKKKEEAKAAAQSATPPVETTPAPTEAQVVGDMADKPVESIEDSSRVEGTSGEQNTVADAGGSDQGAESTNVQTNEDSAALLNEDMERRCSITSQTVPKGPEATAADTPTEDHGGMMGSSAMTMNGMPNQMNFGFPNQGGFNNGMNFGMNGMPNMMANGNWNDFNNMANMNGMPNGMYGNFGGNMGMGMNDMSAMNYGGGYGGWNGMGGGYANFNGFNQMGGYNQSGAYPDMMSQFPKNNFSNQNQNRSLANQGGAYPQRNTRNGSQGSFGPGSQKANSRPSSRGGLARNRDDQSPDGAGDLSLEAKADSEQVTATTETTGEGKASDESTAKPSDLQGTQDVSISGETGKEGDDATNSSDNNANNAVQNNGLNQIQTFDSGDAEMQDFNQPMMGTGMQPNMPYGMMNNFNAPQQFNSHMNMGYNNYSSRGAFNNGAYGAAKVLTEQPVQPIGVGVAGAPTGPRAMREGRPNTGFSGRVSSARFNQPPPKPITPVQDATPKSPERRVRSRSPVRDESLRVKDRSPTRSKSRSPLREDRKDDARERSRSAGRELRREDRGRSLTPQDEEDYERRKGRRDNRSSRHDEREEEYDGRHSRDDRGGRGDRTRSTSAESKYRSSRHEKEKHRSSRSHRDRSKEHRRRHRSRSPADGKYDDDDNVNESKESDSGSRRRHRSDKERHRDRSREKERDRDRRDRKERDRDHDYDRSRDKDKDRRRRRERDDEEEERDYDDDKYRSSRRSRKERDRERSSRHDERDREDRDDRDYRDDRQEKASRGDREEDVVGNLMKKRPASPPLNAPTGPSANGFSIKGRSRTVMPPPGPVQPPSGPRALQPPKGPSADRNRERSDSKDHKRKSSTVSIPSRPAASSPTATTQDHYAADRERNARERDFRERGDKSQRDTVAKSLHSRVHSSSSRPSLSSKRSRDDIDDTLEPPRGPKADFKPPSGPGAHRDKRRKSGAGGDDNIANLFTAGLRKNAKARRGGVRTEGDIEREMERVERERERR